MQITWEGFIALIGIIFASNGLWTFMLTVWTTKHRKQSAESRLLLGLAFNRIIEISHRYIDAGEIDTDEYKELNHYLFEPYEESGGDGTAKRMIEEVKKLPLKKRAVV